ncbi:TRAP transporter large permease [Paracoccus fistulariae]|uniref:TRAP transporter large permease protein n=1 Tax=Paracoccus fistulariae TaxID=658446 RepID=A0ABY7SMW1_9RHOB|nr:TRAP transporter large permease subunit [Paracoccus fistulariae]MDB6181277.1 TRAP transporter large permease subunit [Paracoccus fistulariae]WCR07326.1 TRAP transporter large permease subunit [Paracoccus fistulariae]
MTPEILTYGMFGTLLIAVICGVSLSFAMGGTAVIFGYLIFGPNGMYSIVSAAFGGMWSILLSAIPLFTFIGVALAKSRIASDLYHAFYLWSGRMPGGLLLGTSGFAATLSAMTGSCAASTITTGMVGIPAMDQRGYDRKFVLGTIGASGTLGILIPPSITLILIGMQTGQSIGRLFLGGMIAGLIVLAVFMGYVAVRSWLRPELAPTIGETPPLRERLASLKSVILPVLIILSVLVSIFQGIATPTEAAAIGAAAVTLSVALRGELNWRYIKEVSYTTASVTGMVIWIVFGATAFTSIYGSGGGTAFMQQMLTGLSSSPLITILLIQLITLILGMFLDPVGIILLVLPIFFPIVVQLGFDPIWFCILFQLNLCIGYVSPPFGYNLFYLKTLSPRTPITQIYAAVLPFLLLMLGVGALIFAFPQLITAATSA